MVSTSVGGVPEVLPEDLILMGKPCVSDLTRVLAVAIRDRMGDTDDGRRANGENAKFDPLKSHERISRMYSWDRVATKTVQVYEKVLKQKRLSLLQRLARYKSIGPFAGYVACLYAISVHLFVTLVEWWQPQHLVDVVQDLQPFNAADY